jgi:hypothetical protein
MINILFMAKQGNHPVKNGISTLLAGESEIVKLSD